MKISKNIKNKTALVVGVGSVGLKHVEKLTSIGLKISILEIDKRKLNKLTNKNSYKFYFEISEAKKFNYDLIIIASTGPSHYSLFASLSSNSKNFLIEKPLANSIERVDQIFEITKKKKLNVLVHHQRNFYELPKIKMIFQKYKETPKQVVCFGGNTCLVTTGIHIFDLVCELFNEIPKFVLADFHNDKINPRGKNLIYLSGFLKFYYSKGKTLTFDVSNKTNIKNRSILNSKYLSLELNAREIYFNRYQPPKNKKPSVTVRYKNDLSISLDNKTYYKKMIKYLINEKIPNKYYEKKRKINQSFLSFLNAKNLKKENIKVLIKKFYYKKHNVS
jgi:hypothetical protein